MPLDLKISGNDLVLKIHVQPRASRNQVSGRHGDALKLRLTAPPVDGEANKMCIEHLARMFKLPKSAVHLVAGHTRRTKIVRLTPPPGKRESLEKQILSLAHERAPQPTAGSTSAGSVKVHGKKIAE
jgi:uncharacterized protein